MPAIKVSEIHLGQTARWRREIICRDLTDVEIAADNEIDATRERFFAGLSEAQRQLWGIGR